MCIDYFIKVYVSWSDDMSKDKVFIEKLKSTSEYCELAVSDKNSINELSVCKEHKAYIFKKELFGLEKSKIITMKHPLNINVIPHSHDYIEIQYVISGSITQIIDGERVVLNKGNMMLFNKNVVHSIEKAQENDLMYFIFINESLLDTRFFNTISKENPISKFLFQSLRGDSLSSNYMIIEELNSDIIQLLNSIYLESRIKAFDYENLLIAYVIALFIKMGRQEKIVGLKGLHNVSRKKRQILEIDNYLRDNFKCASLNEAAAALSIHPNYMCRVIKDITGQTFGELLTNIRMEVAETLLTSTNLSVENIAWEIGYANSAYFYKLFKRKKNMTPTQYRKATRKEIV